MAKTQSSGSYSPGGPAIAQLNKIGQPVKTKTTSKGMTKVTQPDEPLDIGSLLLMLLMSGAFNKKNPGQLGIGEGPGMPTGLGPLSFYPGAAGGTAETAANNPLIQALMSIPTGTFGGL